MIPLRPQFYFATDSHSDPFHRYLLPRFRVIAPLLNAPLSRFWKRFAKIMNMSYERGINFSVAGVI